jgi:hypothetical protein
MKTVLIALTAALFLAAGCSGKSSADERDDHAAVSTKKTNDHRTPPSTISETEEELLGQMGLTVDPNLHVEQDSAYPVKTWVRTTTFDGRPFLGFTYVDSMKGNSMKGEPTEGLSDAELSEKLNGAPGYTMSPMPAGHEVTPLTEAEIAALKLPAQPEWLSFYE